MAATKCDSKDNLVTSSMMLVNNPVSDHMTSYDPRMPYMAQSGTSTSSGASSSGDHDMSYMMYPDHYTAGLGPFSYGTYTPYPYIPRGGVMTSPRNCPCRTPPVQDTFLHQILSGKGYKNAQLCVTVTPYIKQERVYQDYCCYGYSPMGYGYSTHH